MKKALFILSLLFFNSCSVYPAHKIISINAETALRDPDHKYNYSNLIDGTNDSWCEGLKGDGSGQNITFLFEKSVEFDSFFIKNGIGQKNEFMLRNRVKELKIFFNRKDSRTITLEDRAGFQKIKLDKKFSGMIFNIKIISSYKGAKWDDTCIAEVAFGPITLRDKKISVPLKKPVKYKKDGYTFTLLSNGRLQGRGHGKLPCKFPFIKGWWNITNQGYVSISAGIDTSGKCTKLDRSVIDHPYLGYIIKRPTGGP